MFDFYPPENIVPYFLETAPQFFLKILNGAPSNGRTSHSKVQFLNGRPGRSFEQIR